MRRKKKTIECIEYLSVSAPLDKVDRLEDKQSKYIHEYVKNKEYMIVGTERRHGFSQNDVDRQWHQIVDKIRKKQVDGVIVANMSVITDNLIDAFIKIAQVQAAGGVIVTVDDGRLAMQLRGFYIMKKNKRHYDKYKKFDVVYADFGRNPHGVQGGIRPGIVVSCDASNHGGAPQISVVPLSSKLKDNPVHVIVEPSEIRGYALSNRSDFMPEDIQTLNKGCVRFKSGYIPGESEIREAMDRAMIMQLNLLPVARKMVLEELEVKQNG